MLEYKKYVSIGNVRLNDNREHIRSELDSLPDVFQRTQADTNSSDHFKSLGIFIYYDTNDKCDAIEFIAPANVIYNGFSFLNKSYKEILNFISNASDNIEEDNEGFISKSDGIAVYAPDKNDSDNALPETIMFFKEGYYD